MVEEKDLKDRLIELRKSTGMNRRQFCEYFEIPYMTVSDWEHGNRRVPSYFFRLLEYYVRTERLKKGDKNIEEK
ncbi:MAG: helix-turn-helix transcriptional regulator [Lachnospiraceae bacterium]|nr:helix-turn-helix transcriptional regulator [Lachnospiraceae bacterium]